jgi:hypothetical protein
MQTFETYASLEQVFNYDVIVPLNKGLKLFTTSTKNVYQTSDLIKMKLKSQQFYVKNLVLPSLKIQSHKILENFFDYGIFALFAPHHIHFKY